jgi:hypothetical protein
LLSLCAKREDDEPALRLVRVVTSSGFMFIMSPGREKPGYRILPLNVESMLYLTVPVLLTLSRCFRIGQKVGEGGFVLWLSGELLFRVGKDALRRWSADTSTGVSLHRFDLREYLLLRFAHDVLPGSEAHGDYA